MNKEILLFRAAVINAAAEKAMENGNIAAAARLTATAARLLKKYKKGVNG